MWSGLVGALVTLLILVVCAIRAHRTLPPVPHLPMQFGFDGKPTWFAPRKVALAFVPLMTLMPLLLTSGFSVTGTGTQGTGLAIALSIYPLLIGIQQLHFRLMRNWFAKGSAY